MFDNSVEADPAAGHRPSPKLVLHVENRKILAPADLSHTPGWTRAIVAAALKLSQA